MTITFPDNILNKYRFSRELIIPNGNYLFAIYKDFQGKEYFGKFWHESLGKTKLKHLITEMGVLKVLNKVELKSGASRILSPRLRHSHVSPELTFYLSDKIEGCNLVKLPTHKQINYIQMGIDYIHYIGNISKNNFKIPIRSPFFYLLTFPLLFVKSAINYPQNLTLYIRFLFRFYVLSVNLFRSKTVFNHRDLNLKNFILANNDVYIIDFQLSAFTVGEFEYASVVRSIVRNKNLTERFVKLLKSKYLTSRQSLNALKACMIYYAMMGMIDKRFSNQRTEDFIKTLKFTEFI